MAELSIPISYFAIFGVLWLGVISYLAYRGWRETETMTDMVLARGDWGPVVLGFSTAATMASAATILGLPGLVYGAGGYAGLWASIAKWPAFALGILVFAKPIRRLGGKFGSLSVPDWLGHMYDNDIVRVVAALLVTFQGAWVIAQIAGMSQLISGLTVIPYQTAVLVATVAVFGYTFVGGESAVQSSDFFQGVLMVFVTLAAVAAGFWVIPGGFGNLAASVAQNGSTTMFSEGFPIFDGPFAVIAWGVYFFALTISAPVGKKFLSLNSARDLKLYIGTVLFTMMIWDLAVLPGLYAVSLFPNLGAPDQAMVQLIGTAFPPIVAAAMAFAIFSASVSTVDSVIIALTVSYTNDLYRRFLVERGFVHGGKSEAEIDRYTVWLSRGFIVLIGVIAALLATSPPQYIAILVTTGNFGFISSAFAPVALGIFWDKANSTGALASLILGPIVYVYLSQFSPWFVAPFKPGLITLIFTTLLMIAVSYATAGRSEVSARAGVSATDD
jgi:Na+/proline symporter